MKRFLAHISIFFIIFLCLAFSLSYIVFFIVRENADFSFETHPIFLVAWHSHPECAFDDQRIIGMKNIAESGERYFYTYWKIQKVLEDNPSISTVFVEFTNNQVAFARDEWTWGNGGLFSFFPRYAPFLDLEWYTFLLKNNLWGHINMLWVTSREKMDDVFYGNFSYQKKVWGYLPLMRWLYKIPGAVWTGIIDHRKVTPPTIVSQRVSDIELLYLRKIIDLVHSHGKRIILIRSPQSPTYPEYANEDFYKKILRERFSDVEYIDFADFPLIPSSYGDVEHLNVEWAKVFSSWFNELLQAGLLQRKNMQTFANQSIHQSIKNEYPELFKK